MYKIQYEYCLQISSLKSRHGCWPFPRVILQCMTFARTKEVILALLGLWVQSEVAGNRSQEEKMGESQRRFLNLLPDM